MKIFEVFVSNPRFKNFRDFLHQIVKNFCYFLRLNKYETSSFRTFSTFKSEIFQLLESESFSEVCLMPKAYLSELVQVCVKVKNFLQK